MVTRHFPGATNQLVIQLFLASFLLLSTQNVSCDLDKDQSLSECSVLQGLSKTRQLDGLNSLNQARKGSVCSLSKARACGKQRCL